MVTSEAQARKNQPVATGVLDYFPDALRAVAELSRVGNDQHNPGTPLHWDRSKSGDESDALIRHFLDRGKLDTDGVRHSAKVAWRALALLQKEIEAARAVRVESVKDCGEWFKAAAQALAQGAPAVRLSGVVAVAAPSLTPDDRYMS